ncbi:PucR family transcriptional regulator ligand-binding domain-containing protein, partial [Phytoactinopolyspora endophytica]|uniref:PucR family transcriptional regulator ligand-binding domain-containing protein n=1 Tax=Phytoactinopolyspora endophytica TaxID=1642495 RepID=UPI00197CA905
MSLMLREILDLPEIRAAAPALTTAPAGVNRDVTWAHSSEIFEIGPLLSGGELLLTTGLGLSGADAGARRYWIRDLAERGVAAVAIETGRSFTTVPDELIDEADRCELPLVRLDRVVPFEHICRAVNTVLLDRESVAMRLVDQLSDQLLAALAGGGLDAIARTAAAQTGRSVAVSTSSGRLVAAGGVSSAKALHRIAAEAVVRAPVLVDGRPWGEVLVGEETSAGDPGGAGGAGGAVRHLPGDPPGWPPQALTP